MLHKKFIIMLLLNASLINAQPIISTDASQKLSSPFFSAHSIQTKFTDFKRELKLIKQCLFTGPCTEEEKKAAFYKLKKAGTVLVIGIGGIGAYLYWESFVRKVGRLAGEGTATGFMQGVQREIPNLSATVEQEFKVRLIQLKDKLRTWVSAETNPEFKNQLKEIVAILSQAAKDEFSKILEDTEFKEKIEKFSNEYLAKVGKDHPAMALLKEIGETLREIKTGEVEIDFQTLESSRIGIPQTGKVSIKHKGKLVKETSFGQGKPKKNGHDKEEKK